MSWSSVGRRQNAAQSESKQQQLLQNQQNIGNVTSPTGVALGTNMVKTPSYSTAGSYRGGQPKAGLRSLSSLVLLAIFFTSVLLWLGLSYLQIIMYVPKPTMWGDLVYVYQPSNGQNVELIALKEYIPASDSNKIHYLAKESSADSASSQMHNVAQQGSLYDSFGLPQRHQLYHQQQHAQQQQQQQQKYSSDNEPQLQRPVDSGSERYYGDKNAVSESLAQAKKLRGPLLDNISQQEVVKLESGEKANKSLNQPFQASEELININSRAEDANASDPEKQIIPPRRSKTPSGGTRYKLLENLAQPVFTKGGSYPLYDSVGEISELTSPKEAWDLSAQGGAAFNTSSRMMDFTTLIAQLNDYKSSTEFEPVPVTPEELAVFGIKTHLLFYSVESLELPVYRQIVPTVELGMSAAKNPSFVRHVHRGDRVLGIKTEQIKKSGATANWLQVAQQEFIPISSHVVGHRGNIVHLRLDMKINATHLVNFRTYDVIRRECAWVRDMPARQSCFRMMHLIAETRRLMKDLDLVQLREFGKEDMLPNSLTMSFDDKMALLMPLKTPREMCNNIETWSACTQRPSCTWLFEPETEQTSCALDADVSYPVLPKTLPEYNNEFDFVNDLSSDERYFVYQPSGGINNQRIQLETALVICKLLNRTCILPPIGQHTNFYFRYNMHHPRKMVSMQRIFNLNRLSEVVKVRTIPEELSLLGWIDSIGATPYIFTGTGLTTDTSETGWRVVMRDARKMSAGNIWHDNDIKKWFSNDPSRFLFFANFSMWRTVDLLMHSTQYLEVKDHLTFTDTLKEQAMQLVDSLGGNYNAIHLRRGDKRHEAAFDDIARDPNYFGTRFKHLLPITNKIYVASDERNQSYFDPLREMGYEIFTYHDFDQVKLNSFLARYPSTMYFDILGILEQLVCSYSLKFLGSPFSTFTLYILRMRKLFPLLSQTFDDQESSELPVIFDGFDVPEVFESDCNPYDPQHHNVPC